MTRTQRRGLILVTMLLAAGGFGISFNWLLVGIGQLDIGLEVLGAAGLTASLGVLCRLAPEIEA